VMLMRCQHGIGPESVGNDARVFGIPIMDAVRILNITFQKTVAGSKHNTWSTLIKKTEGLAHTIYLQKLCLIHRDHFGCRCLLSKLWYCTQLLPITSGAVRHIVTTIAWFTWKREHLSNPLVHFASSTPAK